MFFLAIVREQIKRVTRYMAEILLMLRKTLPNQSEVNYDHIANQGTYSYRFLYFRNVFHEERCYTIRFSQKLEGNCLIDKN